MADIIYAEDRLSLRKLIAENLSDVGHNIIDVGDGQQTLDLIHSGQRLDLLITDIGMPVLNGYDLINTLNDEGYKFPILVHAAGYDSKKVNYSGRIKFLMKGCSQKDLNEAIESILNK